MTTQTHPSFNKTIKEKIYRVLETYANVHRGSGHKSVITTELYEEARNLVLDYLGLKKNRHTVIFSSPGYGKLLCSKLQKDDYIIITSRDLNIPIAVTALAVKKKALPPGPVSHAGGGTARLMSAKWVMWNKTPERFEPSYFHIGPRIIFQPLPVLINSPILKFTE